MSHQPTSSLYAVLCLLLCGICSEASAVSLESGDFLTSVGFGPSAGLGSTLALSPAYFTMTAQAEYLFQPQISAIADLSLSLSGTIPLIFHVGAKARIPGLKVPVSPYAQLQFSAGSAFDVLGTNLALTGVKVGVGMDYFLTKHWLVGGFLAVDFMSTIASESAFFGMFDMLFVGSYKY